MSSLLPTPDSSATPTLPITSVTPTTIDELLDTQAIPTPDAPSQLSQDVATFEASLKATISDGEQLMEDVIDKAKELFS